MKPLRQQSHQIEQQLRQYVMGTYDEAKVRTLATQKAQIEAELTVAETRIHNQLFQLLTADQQSEAKANGAEPRSPHAEPHDISGTPTRLRPHLRSSKWPE